MANYTIIGEQWVSDPFSLALKGKKQITQFIMRDASFRDEILAACKNIQDGSLAIDMETGDNYFLLGGAWLKQGWGI